MIFRTLVFSLILLLSSASVMNGEEISPAFRNLGQKEGFTQTNILSMYQDISGAIWVAGNNGLSRYSGVVPEDSAPIISSGSFNPVNVKSVFGEDTGFVYFLQNTNVWRYDIRSAGCSAVFSTELVSGQTLYAASVKDGKVAAASDEYLFIMENDGKEYRIPLPDKGEVTALRQMRDGSIYIGILSSGLYKAEGEGGDIRPVLDIASKVNGLYEDSRGILWICTRSEGLISIAPDGKTGRYVHSQEDKASLIDNYARCICEDGSGRMWIGTMFGLDCLDPDTGTFRHFGKSGHSSGLRNLTVECLLRDRTGKIWCGSFYAGLTFFDPSEKDFEVITVTDEKNTPVTILCDIVVDRHGDIWSGTSDSGIWHYDISEGRSRFFSTRNSAIPGNNVKSLVYERETDRLWIGMFMGGVAVMDIRSGRITRVDLSADGFSREDLEIVHSLDMYGDYVYAATYAGICRIDRNTLRSEIIIPVQRVFNVLALGEDSLCAVTGQNYFRVFGKNGSGEYVQSLGHGFSGNKVTVMRKGMDGCVWLGTTHGGAVKFDAGDNTFTSYRMSECGISSDYVTAVAPLEEDIILLGTISGLSMLKPSTGQSENFTSDTGFPLTSMENGAIAIGRDGYIYGSGVNAIVRFRKSALEKPAFLPGICLSSLSVNDRQVYPGDGSGMLSVPLQFTSRIDVGYESRILDFNIGTDIPGDFSLMDFQYRLKGYDDEWKALSENSIRYMNLPAGKYMLELRSRPDRLFRCPSETSLQIRVHPPFYASAAAFFLYIALLVSVTAVIIIYAYSRKQFRQTLEFERKDKERIEQVNQWKLVFFTNISHELKTPLTIILSQIDFLGKYRFEEPVSGLLRSVKRNAWKLKVLVDELLDFRKQEQGYMSLKVSNSDIVSYLRSVCRDFTEYGEIRKIGFSFDTAVEESYLWFDEVQLQKVFYNLISNAFKHTEAGGAIKVSLEQTDDEVIVKVSDTGHGIDASRMPFIFDRFYHEGADMSDTGVGIGLALSKGIVTLHGGSIEAESVPGTGSVFTVRLDRKHDFSHDEHVSMLAESPVHENVPEEDTFYEEKPAVLHDFPEKPAAEKQVLLIVEDDPELRTMLEHVFHDRFEVYAACDGEEGLSMARKLQPDLVISDVMMPKMSGTDMCRALRDDFATCHIPVILLTALSSSGNLVEGLESGADDYIAKPFEADVLVAKCNTLIRNRDILRRKYITGKDSFQPAGKDPAPAMENPLDSEFAASVMELVRKHMDDPDLDINLMCRELALSRTLLFVKIKGVFGKTPTGLVQDVRIEEAARLLRERPDLMVSEIADMVGVNSLQYFGKIFKSHFGMTPRRYRSSQTGQDRED